MKEKHTQLFLNNQEKCISLLEELSTEMVQTSSNSFSNNEDKLFSIPEGYYPIFIPIQFVKTKFDLNEGQVKNLKETSDAIPLEKIPRPANPFILYRRDKQEIVKENYKDASFKEISQIIGEMWRNEKYEVKQRYLLKAENEKEAHKIRYPNYKYRPRTDIKRRNKSGTTKYRDMNPELFSSFDYKLDSHSTDSK